MGFLQKKYQVRLALLLIFASLFATYVASSHHHDGDISFEQCDACLLQHQLSHANVAADFFVPIIKAHDHIQPAVINPYLTLSFLSQNIRAPPSISF